MAGQREPSRISAHLKVFLYAVIFGMIAYGFVHLGMAVHRAVQG